MCSSGGFCAAHYIVEVGVNRAKEVAETGYLLKDDDFKGPDSDSASSEEYFSDPDLTEEDDESDDGAANGSVNGGDDSDADVEGDVLVMGLESGWARTRTLSAFRSGPGEEEPDDDWIDGHETDSPPKSTSKASKKSTVIKKEKPDTPSTATKKARKAAAAKAAAKTPKPERRSVGTNRLPTRGYCLECDKIVVTPQWRKTTAGTLVCNACGLQLRKKGLPPKPAPPDYQPPARTAVEQPARTPTEPVRKQVFRKARASSSSVVKDEFDATFDDAEDIKFRPRQAVASSRSKTKLASSSSSSYSSIQPAKNLMDEFDDISDDDEDEEESPITKRRSRKAAQKALENFKEDDLDKKLGKLIPLEPVDDSHSSDDSVKEEDAQVGSEDEAAEEELFELDLIEKFGRRVGRPATVQVGGSGGVLMSAMSASAGTHRPRQRPAPVATATPLKSVEKAPVVPSGTPKPRGRPRKNSEWDPVNQNWKSTPSQTPRRRRIRASKMLNIKYPRDGPPHPRPRGRPPTDMKWDGWEWVSTEEGLGDPSATIDAGDSSDDDDVSDDDSVRRASKASFGKFGKFARLDGDDGSHSDDDDDENDADYDADSGAGVGGDPVSHDERGSPKLTERLTTDRMLKVRFPRDGERQPAPAGIPPLGRKWDGFEWVETRGGSNGEQKLNRLKGRILAQSKPLQSSSFGHPSLALASSNTKKVKKGTRQSARRRDSLGSLGSEDIEDPGSEPNSDPVEDAEEPAAMSNSSALMAAMTSVARRTRATPAVNTTTTTTTTTTKLVAPAIRSSPRSKRAPAPATQVPKSSKPEDDEGEEEDGPEGVMLDSALDNDAPPTQAYTTNPVTQPDADDNDDDVDDGSDVGTFQDDQAIRHVLDGSESRRKHLSETLEGSDKEEWEEMVKEALAKRKAMKKRKAMLLEQRKREAEAEAGGNNSGGVDGDAAGGSGASNGEARAKRARTVAPESVRREEGRRRASPESPEQPVRAIGSSRSRASASTSSSAYGRTYVGPPRAAPRGRPKSGYKWDGWAFVPVGSEISHSPGKPLASLDKEMLAAHAAYTKARVRSSQMQGQRREFVWVNNKWVPKDERAGAGAVADDSVAASASRKSAKSSAGSSKKSKVTGKVRKHRDISGSHGGGSSQQIRDQMKAAASQSRFSSWKVALPKSLNQELRAKVAEASSVKRQKRSHNIYGSEEEDDEFMGGDATTESSSEDDDDPFDSVSTRKNMSLALL